MVKVKNSKIKNWLKKNYLHIICCCLTLVFVMVSIFVFSNAYVRIAESFKDLWCSLKFFFVKVFRLDKSVTPTITNYSKVGWTPFFNLPTTWTGFCERWKAYWNTWVTFNNFKLYLALLGKIIVVLFFIFVFAFPIILILRLLFNAYLSKQNNDYAKDSKPLTFVKWFVSKTYIPIKNWLITLFVFIKEHDYYFKIWLVLWAFNFNVFTIFIEFIAFYFYFVMSFDFLCIYKQIYKLFCDLSVVVAFIPPFIWVMIFIWWFDKFRRNIGYATLNHFEHKNCGFINERPIVIMVVGTMGKKKTTVISDIALSQEVMLRDKAFEKIIDNDMKFPYFPWVNLENAIKYAIENHVVYNLATIRKFIKHLAFCFYFPKEDNAVYKSIKRHLKRRFHLCFDNLCFDYDFERYGLYYDDKLKVVNVWQVIETYAQLYFVYIIQSSLLISNYSIRTDNVMASIGNFPMWDNDFFRRDSKTIDAISRHAHIIDFDALRLGKKVIEDNFKKDSFEFGVLTITEVGKERKNNLELQEKKKKDESANQKNDGFNDCLKMIRHSATIDNFPFVKVITDEQRPESWGADARDLCEIVHIKETSETRLAMPFFTLTELFYSFIYDKFVSLYAKYRFNRADNTLLMYCLKKVLSILNNYYLRTYNTFGYCKLDIQIESGTQDGQLNNKNYYLMSKKIYSKRFSTDCFSDFFETKSLRSAVGLNDLEEYITEKATFEELKKQNSYFINDLINKQGTDTDL